MKIKKNLFFLFLVLSGCGWLCDFLSFTLLVKLIGAPDFVANFISSYVGVTFVWFTSLNRVFGQSGQVRGRFLFFYWAYQFVSILVYSQLLHFAVGWMHIISVPIALAGQVEIVAKIIVTPFNLVTNFIFMKTLTQFIKRTRSH